MKIPKKPPTSSGLAIERIIALATNDAVIASDRYLHWNELRFRKPPAQATPEEWWFALKLLRSAGRQFVSLLGNDGRPFSFVMPPKVLSAMHRVDVGAGGTIIESDPLLKGADRDRYITRSLIEEAITSSQLEGATTTRLVAKELLRSGRAPRDRSERMIVNNYLTMEHIRTVLDEPLTPDLVLDIHRMISDDALDRPDAAGRFRLPSENVVVADVCDEVMHTPPPATELPGRMEKMCAFANAAAGEDDSRFIHPLLQAIILHFWLAYDHPFVDGNGRTARALFYWSMLRSGYWLFEFVTISRLLLKAPAAYARAFLYTETDDNDLTYFLLHQCDVITRAIDDLHEYIEKKSAETSALARDLRAMRMLNHRQQALMAHALRHPRTEYTIAGHQRSHDTAYATARADLLGLENLGLLVSRRDGARLVFTAVDDLSSKLKRPGRAGVRN